MWTHKVSNMLKVKMLTNSWLPLQTCISLLNIDQQILSQSNAKIGPNIITPDQTGFLTERQLAEKVRQMINIIEYWNKINTVTLILTLDTEKKHLIGYSGNLYLKLWMFCSYNRFIDWLKALYKLSTWQVKVNGTPSDRFEQQRGIRHGDATSHVCSMNWTPG